MKITWIQPYYDLILNQIPVDTKTILDVGAGYGIFGFVLKKSRTARVEAVEPFEYDLKHYDHVWRATWESFWRATTVDNFYDVVVSTEMVEHLDHKSALEFLHDATTIGTKVIIATPYEYEQQESYDGNPYQVHHCLVTKNDFIKQGYKIKLLGTFNLKGLTARFYYHPKWEKILRLIGINPTNIIGLYDNE